MGIKVPNGLKPGLILHNERFFPIWDARGSPSTFAAGLMFIMSTPVRGHARIDILGVQWGGVGC